MSSDEILIVKLVVATLITPTITFLAVRHTRPGTRPLAAKIAAWLCMWIGQMAFVMAFATYVALWFAYDWWRDGHILPGVVFGIGGGLLSAFLMLQSLRVFVLGTLALGQATDDAVSAAARKLRGRGLVALVLVVLYWVAIFNIFMPGGWGVLAYLLFVTIPITLSMMLVGLIGVALVGPPWRI